MIKVTQSAIAKLKDLIVEHPEDPIVRVQVRDQDEHRITFSITLEDAVRSDDEAQDIEGVTVAVDGKSAARMSGVTLEYQESTGFSFKHPEETGQNDDFKLNLINLN